MEKLWEDEAPEAYDHLSRIRDALLASGELEHADDFDWEVYLVDDPQTLNAFAAPGGYMFFYTGLIDYLDDNMAEMASRLKEVGVIDSIPNPIPMVPDS